jgi:hypothetical protein
MLCEAILYFGYRSKFKYKIASQSLAMTGLCLVKVKLFPPVTGFLPLGLLCFT